MFKKTLIAEFFTTISFVQFLEAFHSLTFWIFWIKRWKQNKKLKHNFLSYLWLDDSRIVTFYNWRSAIYHCLKRLKLESDSEVILNWYNCISVANAVVQAWFNPVYADINKSTLSFSVKDLESKITEKTRIIIVQHTFWNPAKIDKIKQLCINYNLILIEDVAHSLWALYRWQKLWTFWDFAIFSTGRDKVISSVNWWILVINNENYFKIASKIEKKLVLPSFWLTVKNLNYNIYWYLAYKLYDFLYIWKIIIFLAKRLRLITEIIDEKEKSCDYNNFNYSLPNSLAYLANKELKRLDKYNNYRIKLAEFYNKNISKKLKIFKEKQVDKDDEIEENIDKNIYFRYPILCKDEDQAIFLYKLAKRKKILLWNSWSWINIAPKWSNLLHARYKKWTCTKAEDISTRILLLPINKHIKIKHIKRILGIL